MVLFILLHIKRQDIYIYIYMCCHFTDTTTCTLSRDTQKFALLFLNPVNGNYLKVLIVYWIWKKPRKLAKINHFGTSKSDCQVLPKTGISGQHLTRLRIQFKFQEYECTGVTMSRANYRLVFEPSNLLMVIDGFEGEGCGRESNDVQIYKNDLQSLSNIAPFKQLHLGCSTIFVRRIGFLPVYLTWSSSTYDLIDDCFKYMHIMR